MEEDREGRRGVMGREAGKSPGPLGTGVLERKSSRRGGEQGEGRGKGSWKWEKQREKKEG